MFALRNAKKCIKFDQTIVIVGIYCLLEKYLFSPSLTFVYYESAGVILFI